MKPDDLPPCGLYRTVKAVGEIPADRLVYFHNHGNPGPGLYLPKSWSHNRANFNANGMTVPPGFDPRSLRALPREGFYRVSAPFFCCAKQCTKFEPETMVQLGYNGNGKPILFHPSFGGGAITVPERGNVIDDVAMNHLVALAIAERKDNDDLSLPRGIIVH